MRTSVKFMVIYRHKDKYSISEMCRFFNVSRSGYYDYVKRMDIPAKNLPLADKIRECQINVVKLMGIAEYIYGLKGKEYTIILKPFSE